MAGARSLELGMSFSPGSDRLRLTREGLWIGSGQIAAMAGRFVGIRLITDLVSPRVYGEVALVLGLAVLASNVFCVPVLQATLRFYSEAARAEKVGILRRLIVRMLWPNLAAVLLLLLVGGSVWAAFSRSVEYSAFVAAAAMLTFDVLRYLEMNLLNAARRSKTFALWIAADAVARSLSAVIVIRWFGPSTTAVLSGYAAGSAVTLLGFRSRVVGAAQLERSDNNEEWVHQTRREVLRYAAPLVPLALLGWLLDLGDRYLLAAFAGAEATGRYAAVYGLASQPFISVSGVIATTLRPVLFDAVARADPEEERRISLLWMGAVVGVSFLGFMLLLALGPWLVRIMLGKAFRGAVGLVPWIAGAYAFQGVRHVFEGIISARRKTHLLLILQIVAAISSMVLYVILIPTLGATGAAIGTFVGLAVSCATGALVSGALGMLRRQALARPS
jgi:O-antigen/teichoic acid export membrane protein